MNPFHSKDEYNETQFDADKLVKYALKHAKNMDEIWYIKTKLEDFLEEHKDKNPDMKDRMWLHEFRKKMRLK